MNIRDIFATTIEERIEPVVKVSDRQAATILNELTNLVVTPQWEKHLHAMLDIYTEHFDAVNEHEVGIWISGFFGSGKSLLMKTFGLLLLGGEVASTDLHTLFLRRLPVNSSERADIERALAICQRRISTSLIGGNLHASISNAKDSLALIVFRLFAAERGYTNNWAFAWTIEYQLDHLGLLDAFREQACERTGQDWQTLLDDSDFYREDLNQVAAALLSDRFSGPTAILDAVTQTHLNGITPNMLLTRLRNWCRKLDQGVRRHKVLLQLDELGQWIASGSNATSRLMEVQALIENAATLGEGRIWIVVTAHGDVQALKENVQQELYAKINQRFDTQCKLSNEDIYEVVQKRLLGKKQTANILLHQRFEERIGELTEMGSLGGTRRVYPIPTLEKFADFYPYLPWTVNVIPNVITHVAQATGRDVSLTGSNRTMMGVVQLGILETPRFLDQPIGSLICLADLYPQLSADAPTETRTDMRRIKDNVVGSDDFTVKVAYALYLLGMDEYIPCTLQNVTLGLVDSMDLNLSTLRSLVKVELDRLVLHGYAKQVGENYNFLSTQQRGFQDKVRHREHALHQQNYELSQKLKDGYESYDSLRFEEVTLGSFGMKKSVKVELDGKSITRTQGYVTVKVYSPLQYVLEPEIANDVVLKQRSNQNPDTIFLRMANVVELRRALARAVATDEIASQVLATTAKNDPEYEVARQARQHDLTEYRVAVHNALDDAMNSAMAFMRGTSYHLLDGANASERVRNTLASLLSIIYARLSELPYRIPNEEQAIKAALNDNTSHPDLKALGVYNADKSLNMASSLLSTLKGHLPIEGDDQGPKNADELRVEFEKPPFGWDGNAVKVGLALLLRTSQCRLIENGEYLIDPLSPAVLQALTKVQRFKSLRVQALRSSLNSSDLMAIRGFFEFVFGHKPSFMEQPLHKALGIELTKLDDQAQALQDWSGMTSCALPQLFNAGQSRVLDMLTSTVSTVRLPLFQRDYEFISDYVKLMDDLTHFKDEQSKMFSQLRDFYNSMLNADAVPEAVATFLQDWRVVASSREVTDSQRWNELVQAYQKAQQALTEQIADWRKEILQGIAEMDASLLAQLQEAGVPQDKLTSEATSFSAGIHQLQSRAEAPTLSFSDARRLRSDYLSLRMTLPDKIRRAGERYIPEVHYLPVSVPPIPPARPKSSTEKEIHLYWQQALGKVQIGSSAELDAILLRLKRVVNTELAQDHIVVIE